MMRRALSYFFGYSERALGPKTYSSLLQSTIKNLSLPEIMHNLYLYDSNVQIFDLDYFQRVAYSLLTHQRKMTVADILTVLRLGMKHNVRNEMLWRHFEAELHRRLHNCMTPLFQSEKKEVEDKFQKMYQKLESNSQDYFKILTDEFTQSQAESNSLSQERVGQVASSDAAKELSQKRPSPEITKFVYDLVEILVWYGSENMRLISLLLETQLHPLVLKNSPSATIRNAELLVYALQVSMKEYQKNKQKYTARSIKGIYKLQGSYLPELLKNLKLSLAEFSGDEIKYITEVIRSFPVKKREHRKGVVDLISTEWRSRGQGLLEQHKDQLEEILAKDSKLISKFRETLSLKQEEGGNAIQGGKKATQDQ